MKVVPPAVPGSSPGAEHGLPNVNALHPSVPVRAIGRALSRFYDDLLAEGVPEHMAGLVRQVASGERRGVTRVRRTALVVEDDPDQRAMAETLLEETTLAVQGCASAEEALARLERAPGVAFVFADVHLAGRLDGLDLARRIAVRWPDVRVVLTSGAADVRAADLPPGATFLPKPWRALSLLAEAERAEARETEGRP